MSTRTQYLKAPYSSTLRRPHTIVPSGERARLAMRIFDEYSNVLRCMYSTRFRETSYEDIR
jgi:hypothetical protein